MNRADERTKDMVGEVVRRIDNSRDREEWVIALLENMNMTLLEVREILRGKENSNDEEGE